jgi:hypothetical protein
MPGRMPERMSQCMPEKCQIECQNRCQIAAEKECQNIYAMYASREYARNYIYISECVRVGITRSKVNNVFVQPLQRIPGRSLYGLVVVIPYLHVTCGYHVWKRGTQKMAISTGGCRARGPGNGVCCSPGVMRCSNSHVVSEVSRRHPGSCCEIHRNCFFFRLDCLKCWESTIFPWKIPWKFLQISWKNILKPIHCYEKSNQSNVHFHHLRAWGPVGSGPEMGWGMLENLSLGHSMAISGKHLFQAPTICLANARVID